MRSSSSSSASSFSAKRRKPNPKTSFQRSSFTDFGSYMAEKNRKLRSQFEEEASSSSILNCEASSSGKGKGIFHGVSIFVDGHTVPSSQELRVYMLRHGGRLENYFSRSRVSHIICSNLPDSKMRNFSRGLPVLRPAWVVDSVAANKLLNWSPYQIVEQSSEIYKQTKLSAFLRCKNISSIKDAEVSSDPNDEVDPEYLEKSEGTPLPLESKVFDQPIQVNDEFGLEKGAQFTTLLGEGTEVEASNATSTQLSIHLSSRIDDVSVDAVSSEEPTNPKCLQASDVHHSTLTDPDFVENYFKHSRLHFIGTWRNRYRRRFCNTLERNCSKDNASSISTNKSYIIHIDMDCFFVSVILRKYPELIDKPVAVCHSNNSKGTAEISSANYPARGYGIRAGMFVRDAKNCCPNLFVFPYDFIAYEEVADQFHSILHKHCNNVQALSCDEAFLDITECDYDDPENFASMIRKEIVETTQCTASAGIAGNLLIARLATKIAKPNGQCFIPPEKVEHFLDDLPITTLPGVGHALGDKLEIRKIRTCRQLRLVPKEALHKDFGVKVGDMLWKYCRGIDDRKVEVLKETKSIGAEVNWGVRFRNTMDCEHFLDNLSKEVASRLRECGVVARTVNLKVKKRRKGAKEPAKFMGCGDCENLSRSMTLPVATDDATLIRRIAKQIFSSYHLDAKEVRGVGLQMSRLETLDVNKQGHKHNVIESWLMIPAKVGEVTFRPESRRVVAESLCSSEEKLPGMQRHGPLHENSQLYFDRAAAGTETLYINLVDSRSSENAVSKLPPVSHLDMSVIKDLPAEIISEMNVAYNGKLYDLMKKHDEDQKNNGILLITPPKVIGGKKLEPDATNTSGRSSCELIKPKKAEAFEMMLHQVEKPEVSCSNLNILQMKSTTCTDPLDWASGHSSKAVLLAQNISDDTNLDKSVSRQGVLCHSASVAGDSLWNIPKDIESGVSEKFKNNLWSGSPPKWVEKFEVSNYLILNLIAQLYTKFGAVGLLSPTLQSLISLYPFILGSNGDEPDEPRLYLCELLLQYINHKIDSDIEELYLCCRLLERLTAISNFFSEVYSAFLSRLQVSVSENYGGTLQLTGCGD
ncbi:DNA repair protein REV1 isoform X2 [Phalaenopsis equestris]|uniref:DNA repair protein REV1 isoform X2 n=1 Tax=Phalaenopsis equestris TaxID=78828 RepID=UPI0009E5E655|nr:DNA repair protein REV1 isoform X2 [Phalaenopsis equestris]